MTGGAIASRAAVVVRRGRDRSDRAGGRSAAATRALGRPARDQSSFAGGRKCARDDDAATLGAFPPVAPLGMRAARGGRGGIPSATPAPARRPSTTNDKAQKRGDLVVVLFGVDPSPASTSNGLDADVGFGRLATE